MEDNKLMQELDLDIQEMKSLLQKAERINVKKILEAWIQKCESEKKQMEDVLKTQTPQKIEVEPKKLDQVDEALQKIEKMNFEAITQFGWD